MKKYVVIGNPIEHSMSPKLQNYWIKKNKLIAQYDKMKLDENVIESVIEQLKNGSISGINVTVPFKKSVIPFTDELTSVSQETNSVNIVYKKDEKIIGDNTDVFGFQKALKLTNFDISEKKAFILGAGGVAPSIIYALKSMGVSDIVVSNRTIERADILKKKYPFIKIIKWGDTANADIVINATSLGLRKGENLKIDYGKIGPQKLFYDVIYNPEKTNFLLKAEKFKNQIENGKMMFLYQAQLSFEIWHKIKPEIDNSVLKLLNND